MIQKKRKNQKAFKNREILIEDLKKDYEKYKLRLAKTRGLS